MKSKRILLAVFAMATLGWQSVFALDRTVGGLTFTTTGTLNEVSVRVDAATLAGATSLVIPASVEMYTGQQFAVVEIEDGAFANLGAPNTTYHLNSLTIPASVRKIGNYAFVNTAIDVLTIERDENSTLEVGLDAFGGNEMIIKEVRWGGSIRQWCEVEFASLYSNPIAVKDWTASNANFPQLVLTTPVEHTNSEASTSTTHIASTSNYSVLVNRPAKTSTTQRSVNGAVAAYASTLLLLPADVTTITPYAFANRPFRNIKTMGSAPAISEGTFSFIQNTEVFVACQYAATYNSHSEWKKSQKRTTYVDYVPGAIVNAPAKYIYSSINPSELIATIRYTKPSCTGASNGQWTLTAVMEPGYQFNRWSGGDFNSSSVNPLRGDIDQAMPATAFIDRIIYTVGLSSNNNAMGTIGSNSQLSAYYNENMTLTATANSGYRFVRWSNGHSENPYTIRITSDTALVAYFEKDETIAGTTVYASNFAGEDMHLWRIDNNGNDVNTWAFDTLGSNRLILTRAQRLSYSSVYAYRALKLNASTHYTLTLDQYTSAGGNLQWALVYRNDDNNVDDNTYVLNAASWQTIANSSSAKDLTIHIAPQANSGCYFLAFRYNNSYGTTSSASLKGVSLRERKFAINTVMLPDTADGTLTGSDSVFASASGVVINATPGTGTTARNFGYRFVGWYLDDPTCSGTAVSTATSYSVPASLIDEDHTYYALYEPKPVQITLAASTGIRFLEGNNTASSNQALTAPEDPAYTASEGYLGYTTGIYYGSNRPVNRLNATTLRAVHDQSIVIEAQPVDGYLFDKWSDGNTDNPRTIKLNFVGAASYLSSNTIATMLSSLKPTFKVREDYAVTAVVFDNDENRIDNTMGTVTGTGTFKYNQQVTLRATPSAHYTFVKWVDGNGKEYTDNPLTFKVQGDNYGTPANPQTAKGQNDASRQLKAYFEIEKYTVKIKPNNLEQGNVSYIDPAGGSWVEGQGFVQTIPYRKTVEVKAVPFSGYKFTGWTVRGSDSNPILYDIYTFTPTSDITLEANFEPGAQPSVILRDTVIYDTTRVNVNVPVVVYDTARVNVNDTVHRIVTDTVTVTVTNTVHQTVTVYDTTTIPVVVTRDSIVTVPVYISNPVYVDTVITVTTYQPIYVDTVITRPVYMDSTIMVPVYVNNPIYVDTIITRPVYMDSTIMVPVYVNNPIYVDTVIYNYQYIPTFVDTTIYRPVYIDEPYYDTIAITYDTTICDTLVVTVDNYIHDTVYLYDTVYIYDTVYVGIDDVETYNLKLFQRNGRIVVNGAEGAEVHLFDAVGRLLATKQDTYSELEFDVPASGAYLIRVGSNYTRRIVVVR